MLVIQGATILAIYLAIEQFSNSWTIRCREEWRDAPHLPFLIQAGALIPLVVLPVFLVQLYRPLNWIGILVCLVVLCGLRLWWKLTKNETLGFVVGSAYAICLFLFLFVPFALIIKGEYQFGGKRALQKEDKMTLESGVKKE